MRFPSAMPRWQADKFALGLLLVFVGCSPSNSLNRQAVSGKVTMDGQPLKMGTIRFSPEDPRGVSSGGPITEGAFAIREDEGLPPGRYTVRIYSTAPDESVAEGAPPGLATQKPGIDLVPPRYNAQSELTREVKDGEQNQFDFELTTK